MASLKLLDADSTNTWLKSVMERNRSHAGINEPVNREG